MATVLPQALQQKMDQKTKPTGALGMLETVALKAGMIQQSLSPKIINPHIVIFAADHGIAAEGLVNAYPPEVTAQMVLNFLNGGAAINVFCRHNKIAFKMVDAGVNFDFEESPALVNAKVNHGTANYLRADAMTVAEAMLAVERGKEIVEEIAETGCNTIGLGEMGIGNTSAAALIMHQVLQVPLTECVGRGAGATDAQLEKKLNTLQAVSDFHRLPESAIGVYELLAKVGGFEIAMMTGAYLHATLLKMIIVVDGFVSTAALLLATRLDPTVIDNCIFAHHSDERGHGMMLAHFKAQPLLDLEMRLGEGTGAALAIPLIQSAVNILNEMASFESALGSNKV